MVRGVKALGLEACCTLGMLTEEQARAAQGRGPRRLQPQPRHLARVLPVDHHDPHLRRPPRARSRNVREAGITVCSGGIIGMGETDRRPLRDAASTLATLEPHPESVPINALVPRRRDAARGAAAGRSARAGAHDRRRAHPHAASRWCGSRPGAPTLSREAQLLCMLRRRELDLLRRQAPHHAEPRGRRRCLACLREAGLTARLPPRLTEQSASDCDVPSSELAR